MRYQIIVTADQTNALEHFLSSEEQAALYQALDKLRRDGEEPFYMPPVSRMAMYWILESNNINPQSIDVEPEPDTCGNT